MDNENLTKLARKMGAENASALLSVLGRDKTFLNALDSDVGQELLKDAVKHIEITIDKILNGKDTEEERAELRAYKSILHRWSGIVKRYNTNTKRLLKNSQ